MEKRAALFTEKGVIPFGLEALVDRPAFIHDTSPPRKAEENGWKREELRTAKGKSPLSLLSLLSLFVPFPSVVRETACSLPPPFRYPALGPIDVYFLTKASGNQSFCRYRSGESRMHFVRRSWKISYTGLSRLETPFGRAG